MAKLIQKILVAVDGSDHARQALTFSARLANDLGARLLLIHVMSRSGSDRIPGPLQHYSQIEHSITSESDMLQQIAQSILDEAKDLATSLGLNDVDTMVDNGNPADRIIKAISDNHVDLVAMGRRGLSDFSGLLFGSVSHKVAHLSTCPCLTVPALEATPEQIT